MSRSLLNHYQIAAVVPAHLDRKGYGRAGFHYNLPTVKVKSDASGENPIFSRRKVRKYRESIGICELIRVPVIRNSVPGYSDLSAVDDLAVFCIDDLDYDSRARGISREC
jgi:hypothetical protein